MDLEEYNDCKENFKLATATYPSVNTALSRLQVTNKGTLDAAELAAMNTTKLVLLTRFSANWSDLEQWVSNNPIATIPFSQQTPALSSHSVQAACWRGGQGIKRADDPLTADVVTLVHECDQRDHSVQTWPAHQLRVPPPALCLAPLLVHDDDQQDLSAVQSCSAHLTAHPLRPPELLRCSQGVKENRAETAQDPPTADIVPLVPEGALQPSSCPPHPPELFLCAQGVTETRAETTQDPLTTELAPLNPEGALQASSCPPHPLRPPELSSSVRETKLIWARLQLLKLRRKKTVAIGSPGNHRGQLAPTVSHDPDLEPQNVGPRAAKHVETRTHQQSLHLGL